MRNFLLKILTWKLRKLAQRTVRKFRPGIIGVTGSVGKTSAKRAVAAVLGGGRRIRVSEASLNTEIGVALTVLGDWREREWKLVSRYEKPGTHMIRKTIFFSKVILVSLVRLFFARNENYPEILILEYGVDRPGNMKKLLEIVSPDIGIITAIGDIPVHVEFFSGPEEVAREKAKLIESLPTAGFAILNYDDQTVMELTNRTRAHLMTCGFGKGAEVRISGFKNRAEKGRPLGVGFRLHHAGLSEAVELDNVFGKVQCYAAALGAGVGLIFGISLAKIAQALTRNYRPAGSRMELREGIKFTYIIDDSYNASPLSMHAAIDTLRNLPGKRKIAVLGDMLEIGKYAIEAHEEIGRRASAVADLLVTVGPRAKFIAEAARERGMRKSNILSFDKAEDAAIPVQDLLKKGDLVLLKGSRAMHLEKIAEEIKAVAPIVPA